MKTLGGRQFWGDVTFFRGWRIQQNVLTEHYRLLDPADRRFESGSLEQCQAKLAQIREERSLPAMSGKAVILLHGLIRSSKSMTKLRQRLEQENYVAVPFDYPSTRVDLARCADYLNQVIRSLEGIEEIHFVGHSLGGLVVRAWSAKHQDPRVGRLVMLGTPNQGADLADQLHQFSVFRAVFGPAGQQLTSGEKVDGNTSKLPVPTFPFAVVAGARGDGAGFNPLVPGDDDGTVSVESTRLPGAADFLTVPALHSFLPSNEQVGDAICCFLQTGRLQAPAPPATISE